MLTHLGICYKSCTDLWWHNPSFSARDVPGAASSGSAETVAARRGVLVVLVANPVGRSAGAVATDANNRLRRSNNDRLETRLGIDAANKRLFTCSVEGTLSYSIIVRGVNDANGDIIVW